MCSEKAGAQTPTHFMTWTPILRCEFNPFSFRTASFQSQWLYRNLDVMGQKIIFTQFICCHDVQNNPFSIILLSVCDMGACYIRYVVHCHCSNVKHFFSRPESLWCSYGTEQNVMQSGASFCMPTVQMATSHHNLVGMDVKKEENYANVGTCVWFFMNIFE